MSVKKMSKLLKKKQVFSLTFVLWGCGDPCGSALMAGLPLTTLWAKKEEEEKGDRKGMRKWRRGEGLKEDRNK